MAELLLRGQGVVILGRPSEGEPLQERIRKLLAWFGIEQFEGNIEYYETDFLKLRLGLGAEEYDSLCSRSLSIIHCASDTSFSDKNRDRVMKSNVESLTEILNFAIKSKTPCFHFISTVFAAGTDQVQCHEEPVNSVNFVNVYEESKAYAENIVSRRCRESGIFYTIIRPSIVYGDSSTGKSLRFNALYVPVRSAQVIRDIYLEDIRSNNGKKASACGIYLNNGGVLHLPMKIYIPFSGNINLIPVDYFTETILSIIEKPVSGTFYQVTSNKPAHMQELALYTQRLLKMTGIEIIIGSPGDNEIRNPAEELFHHFIKVYLPYISDRRIFTRENTDRATGGIPPPDLSYEIFEKCIAFAMAVDWGKKLYVNVSKKE